MKRIILTGGGTAGHVTPNMALIPELQKEDYEIHYIGSYDGIEKELIASMDVPYHSISSGKLRRYFDIKNFTDPFKVVKGYSQACRILRVVKPDVVFSKGGFVAVPVVLAARRYRIPCIIHESDMTPGLANKLCIPTAQKVCCNFPETLSYLPDGKAVLTGSPIRKELFQGSKARGLGICEFNDGKPVILVIGGSLGSVAINDAIRSNLDLLLKKFQIIHLCGKDKKDNNLVGKKGYIQFEYVKKDLSDLLAACDIVISRAGANAICELLSLRKPNILIPLSAAASRGDQILNAESFQKLGYSHVIKEEELNTDTLLTAVNDVYDNRRSYIEAMNQSDLADPIGAIVGLIKEY